MKFPISRLLATVAGLLAIFGAQPTFADDSEVFTSSTFTTGAGVRANVLFVVDTSGSMSSTVRLYDPTRTYAGDCDVNYVYWSTVSTFAAPECTGATRRIQNAANRCRTMYTNMLTNGWWNGRVFQLNSGATAWINMTDGVADAKVECEGDHRNHGDLDPAVEDGGNLRRARNGSGTARWGNRDSEGQVDWNTAQYISFYSGNYINWYNTIYPDGGAPTLTKTRLEIVKEVATSMINTLQGVNLGLMRYSNNGGDSRDPDDDEFEARGGMVTYPIRELTTTTRADMVTMVNSWAAAGWTPLSETLYEAQQYLKGGGVYFGQISRLYEGTGGSYPSVAGSRANGDISNQTYDSPMDFNCQRTFIVYLTDGLPTQDTEADTNIMALPNFATDGFVSTADGGGGATCPAQGPSRDPHGRCMVNLAGYMYTHDFRADVTGKQNVTTYVVGFGSDIAESKAYLDNIAKAGGGRAFTQGDSAGLKAALEEIFAEVRQNANTTFVSPTVAVNAFNRTRNLNQLFISVFAPTNRARWPGNIKKYQIINGVLHGSSTTTPAVNPATGFFATGTSDMFNTSATPDGPDVKKGGAASQLPAWDSRNIYTYMGTDANLNAVGNRFATANTAITGTMLGLPDDTRRQEVMEFVLGRDVNDENNDRSFIDTRRGMGDPMHSRPSIAVYGGTEAAPTGTLFATTNDGMLHAFNFATGEELWSFLPREMLERSSMLQANLVRSQRNYGIDGDVRVFKYDADDDGVVETADGDKVYAVFGFARGGSTYYALDVTSRLAPVFLWKKTRTELPQLGDAWSAPVFTRVNVGGSRQTDAQKVVAIFGGGYDTGQENYTYAVDGRGNGIYMVEVATGNVLWSAGRTGVTGVDFTHDAMNNSIPGEISLVDINGDTFADRMYAGDMGGRIWRFDIWHGQAPAALVTGGVFATLGAGHMATPDPESARRFYYAPDVSLVAQRGSPPYFNLAIGSGYRGHPLDTRIRDRFYALRDYQPFNRRTQASYNTATPITDGSLVDVTTNTMTPVRDTDNGWKIELNLDGWRGEKVLAEAITVNGVIFFPTFTPVGTNPTNPCLAATLNRTWAVYMDSGKPFGLRDGQNPGTGGGDGGWVRDPRNRYRDSPMDGIAPGTAAIKTCGPAGCDLTCLVGANPIKCPKFGEVQRTFWERRQ
jgi:type IV pilus assembly protein PilY1